MVAYAERYAERFRPRNAPPPPGGYPARLGQSAQDPYLKEGRHPTPADGDPYWSPSVITQTWRMAETGAIPISGSGYGGDFAGVGYDALWLDMSEIVRPTRDGILGREHIATAVDVGRLPAALRFDDGRPAWDEGPCFTIPAPFFFDCSRSSVTTVMHGVLAAAHELGLAAILPPTFDLAAIARSPHAQAAAPVICSPAALVHADRCSMLVLDAPFDALPTLLDAARAHCPGAVLCARLAGPDLDVDRVLALVRAGVHCVELNCDHHGVAHDVPAPTFLRTLHERLAQAGVRRRVTLLVSGGMALPEHAAKAMACGADAVLLGRVLEIAAGGALWAEIAQPADTRAALDVDWTRDRMINLATAWRDQLLEVLGAMGLSDVRRLSGESGRLIDNAVERLAFAARIPRVAAVEDYPTLPVPPAPRGDKRWTGALLRAAKVMSEQGTLTGHAHEYRTGASGGGFDRLAFRFELEGWDPRDIPDADPDAVDLGLSLNRRDDDRPRITLPAPWYGGGMSFGSVGLPVMLARARAAQALGSFISTGEGGYPEALLPYADHIMTQVATGLFGVSETTLTRARVIEIKYAQGSKPGLGGHLLGIKNTAAVASQRETAPGIALFSPFPFHSVYSVEDHKKHLDWLATVNPRALLAVKVSSPSDVDMVAVGSYYAGAHIINIDGAYGGTAASPELSKKNIATPIEYAVAKAHDFLTAEGLRNEVTLMASGGVRTVFDAAKAIALGADGVVFGTLDLTPMGCVRLARCERPDGCPFGVTTTDPVHSAKVDAEAAAAGLVHLRTAMARQLAGLLQRLDLHSVAALRGRRDLLVRLEDTRETRVDASVPLRGVDHD